MAWISPVRGKHIFKHAIGGHKPAKSFVIKLTKFKCEWKCVFAKLGGYTIWGI